jgi:alkanesulfonate monooxygenase SsuD/methylene tetrahydromethanopterin reductase-like flavin-dependent oxidoreductase (luciferase family)
MRPSLRIERLDEALEIMKRMWTQETATFRGKHYSIIDAVCLPKPIQKPHPPIWIGGMSGSKIMKVIAKHASGWNMMRSSTTEDYTLGLKALKEACARIGRKFDEVKISMTISGSTEECQRKLREFDDQGLDLAILRLPRNREIETLRNLEWEPR